MKTRISLLAIIFLMAIGSGCEERSITGTCCEEKPSVEEGPGEITEDDITCSDEGEDNGAITVVVTNGYQAIWLEDEDGERVPGFYSDGFTPQDGQDHVFSTVPAGTYVVAAQKYGKISRSDKAVVKTCSVRPNADYIWEPGGDELSIYFDASESSDSDGIVEDYEWLDFGDGSGGEGVTITHHYDWPGTYSVPLVVTDNDGLKDTTKQDVVVKAYDFGDIDVDKSCHQYDGMIELNIENGMTGYKFTNTENGIVLDEANELDLVNNKKLEFDNLADVDYRLEIFRYNHEDSRSFSFDCDLDPDDFSYFHEFNGGFDEDIRVNGDDRLKDDLASWEEYRANRSESDFDGKVAILIQAKPEDVKRSWYRAEVCFDKECENSVITPPYEFKAGEDGWVEAATWISAEHFKGYSQKYTRIRVIHGDQFEDSKPDGSDQVTFSVKGKNPVRFIVYGNTVAKAKDGVSGHRTVIRNGETIIEEFRNGHWSKSDGYNKN